MKRTFRVDKGINIDNAIEILQGTGSPEGVVTAKPGSQYSDTTTGAGKIYKKVSGSGNTGWKELIDADSVGASPTFVDISLSAMGRTFVAYGTDTKFATGIPWSERGKFKLNASYESGNSIYAYISFVGANTSFSYYINGKKFTVTATELPTYSAYASGVSSEGVWFFYINQTTTNVASPVMSLTKTPWAITDPDVLLWSFYANDTDNTITWIGEERHTAGRDIFNHSRNHAQGAVYRSGLLASHYNGLSSTLIDTNTDNNYGRALVQISSGSFFDEDILNQIAHSDSSVNASLTNPSTDWNLNVEQFLGFTAIATTGTSPTQIVFPTSRTLITGQAVTVMTGNTTTIRGTTTITTGGTGTTFAVTSVTGLASGDAIVIGARIPIFYISNVAGGVYTWRELATSDFLGVSITTSLAYTTANIAAQQAAFNNASAGGFSAITANRYYPIYLCATNSTFEPVIAILGQGQSVSGTLSTALGEAPFQFSNVVGLSYLGLQEIVPFYRLTYMYNTGAGYTNTRIKLRNATFLDVRVATVSGSILGSPVTSLSAEQVTTDTTNFNQNLSTADTTVQKALDTLDDLIASGTDEKVKASSTATLAGYLNEVLAGSGNKISLVQESGLDNQLSIITGTDILDKAINGQISGMTEKAIAAGADSIHINDSAASNANKKLLVQNIQHSTPITTFTGTPNTLDATHNIVLCNSASAMTVNLPASSGITGRRYKIMNINTGVVTIDGNSAETIRGNATYLLRRQYAWAEIVSDGTNWQVLAESTPRIFYQVGADELKLTALATPQLDVYTGTNAFADVIVRGFRFDASIPEYVYTELKIPNSMQAADTIYFDIWWFNHSTGAGNVVWRIHSLGTADGEAETSTSWTVVAGTFAASTTAKQLKLSTISGSLSSFGLAPGDCAVVMISRYADDGINDTMGNDATLRKLVVRR